MDEKLEKIEDLLTLFDEREQAWHEYNEMIADRIMATTLAALYELFALPSEAIEWIDLQLADAALVVVCAVTYDSSTVLSPFLKKLDQVTSTPLPIDVQRVLRIGVPLTMVFLPKKEIKKFLMDFSVSMEDPSETIVDKKEEETNEIPIERINQETHFDSSKLTKEQLQQLMFFQNMTKEIEQ